MEGRRSGNTLQGPSLHARVRAAHDRRLGQWALTTLVPVHKRECGWGGGAEFGPDGMTCMLAMRCHGQGLSSVEKAEHFVTRV